MERGRNVVSAEPVYRTPPWFIVLIVALLGTVIIAALCKAKRVALGAFLAVLILQIFNLIFNSPLPQAAQVCVTESAPPVNLSQPGNSTAALPEGNMREAPVLATGISIQDAWNHKRSSAGKRVQAPLAQLADTSILHAGHVPDGGAAGSGSAADWWNHTLMNNTLHLRKPKGRAITLEQLEARREARHKKATSHAHPSVHGHKDDMLDGIVRRSMLEPNMALTEAQRSAYDRHQREAAKRKVRAPHTRLGRAAAARVQH